MIEKDASDSIQFLIQVAYFGRAHNEPLEFFRQFGQVCESNFNPADFCRKCFFLLFSKAIHCYILLGKDHRENQACFNFTSKTIHYHQGNISVQK